MSAAKTRPGRWAAARLAGAALPLLVASPALADNGYPLGPSEGADPGRGLGVAATLLLYVVVPLVLITLIAALVWLPGVLRAKRYRPTRGWQAAPVWFAGPPEPATAVQDAQVDDLVRGGASGSW